MSEGPKRCLEKHLWGGRGVSVGCFDMRFTWGAQGAYKVPGGFTEGAWGAVKCLGGVFGVSGVHVGVWGTCGVPGT